MSFVRFYEMKKIKVNLFEKHSNRTPLSYKFYRNLLEKTMIYEKSVENTDCLITGFVRDFKENAQKIKRLIDKNGDLKLVVLSEEPFWDTVWGEDFQNKKSKLVIKENSEKIILNYYNLNHITSRIFDFKYIPYFITTEDSYIQRYKKMFYRNSQLGKEHYLKVWQNAKKQYTFMMTRRVGKKFDVLYNDKKIFGLSRYRSLLCESLDTSETSCEGKGWGNSIQRQSLSDWHLDKLKKMDEKCYIVSALENTYVENYVTEKIFDAFAVQGIPLYYAQKDHRVFDLVNKGSFINLANLSIEKALKIIQEFEIDDQFIESYIDTQKKLYELFSNEKYLIFERQRIAEEIEKEFSLLKSKNKTNKILSILKNLIEGK